MSAKRSWFHFIALFPDLYPTWLWGHTPQSKGSGALVPRTRTPQFQGGRGGVRTPQTQCDRQGGGVPLRSRVGRRNTHQSHRQDREYPQVPQTGGGVPTVPQTGGGVPTVPQTGGRVPLRPTDRRGTIPPFQGGELENPSSPQIGRGVPLSRTNWEGGGVSVPHLLSNGEEVSR